MMSSGKQLRLRRIVEPVSRSAVMFAFSHGTSAPEVMDGLEDPLAKVSAAMEGGADCAFLAPGLVESVAPLLANSPDFGVVVKVTATASRGRVPHQERQICSVERAAELGADGVVALLPFAPDNESDVIRLTADLGEACARLGMPFVAEAEYPNAYYGEADYAHEWGLPYLKRSARLCVECGADIIKSNWPGSPEAFAEIVGCVPVPVVVAGGSRESDLDLLKKIAAAIDGGASGCSVGRNIFQHSDPTAMTRAICAVVRDRRSPEEAFEENLSRLITT
jgi:DhnA family fructose-bisphosphate aldolase class Ia